MNPVAFDIFGFSVRWYGILISFGMILGTIIAMKRAENVGITKEKMLDIFLFAIPMGIIGARLYYVAFNWEFYQGDFFKIINIRAGGLAIHGGLIFGFLTALIICGFMNISFGKVADSAIPSIALAQSIGRWGIFFNQEAYGRPTELPWGILIDGQKMHPTFLYESIWTFLLFFVLLGIDANKKYHGETTLFYVVLYSLARFFIEGLRMDSLMFGSFRVAQLLSAVVCIIGLIIIIKNRSKRKNRIFG